MKYKNKKSTLKLIVLLLVLAVFFFAGNSMGDDIGQDGTDLVTSSEATSSFDPDEDDELFFDSDSVVGEEKKSSFDIDGDDDFFDDPDEFETDEFEDVETTIDSEEQPGEKKPKKIDCLRDFKFTYGHLLSYGPDGEDSGIIANRSSLRVEWEKLFLDNIFSRFDGTGYVFPGSDHVADAEDKSILVSGNLREGYIQAGFEKFSIKAGKQIVVWGETDGGIINDVVSPRDGTEFIFMDMEESRIGQFMLSADYYADCGDFFMFLNLDPKTDKEPGIGTRYYVEMPGMEYFTIHENDPDFFDVEYGMKWKKTMGKGSISFMAAELYQNTPVYNAPGFSVSGRDLLVREYEKYYMAGFAANYTHGSFLFKLDAAYKHDYLLQGLSGSGNFVKLNNSILNAAAGTEYDANGKYMLVIEISNRHIFDYSGLTIGSRGDETTLYFSYLKKIKNDTLQFEYNFMFQVQDRDSLHQAKLTYDFSDSVKLILDYTYLCINAEDGSFWNYRDENRIGVECKYFF